MSPDPIGADLNSYRYASGNPANFSDPSGLLTAICTGYGWGSYNPDDSDFQEEIVYGCSNWYYEFGGFGWNGPSGGGYGGSGGTAGGDDDAPGRKGVPLPRPSTPQTPETPATPEPPGIPEILRPKGRSDDVEGMRKQQREAVQGEIVRVATDVLPKNFMSCPGLGESFLARQHAFDFFMRETESGESLMSAVETGDHVNSVYEVSRVAGPAAYDWALTPPYAPSILGATTRAVVHELGISVAAALFAKPALYTGAFVSNWAGAAGDVVGCNWQ